MTNKTFIIAELSANHNQNFDLAVKTIEAIAKSGADAVKIQTYKPESLALDVDNEYFGALKSGLWKGLRRYELYQKAYTPYEWQPKLQQVAEKLGLVFFSSPFDFEAVDFLEQMNVPIYKIASFEINDIPLIRHVAKKGKPIIMSTGIADKEDIRLALDTCRREGVEDISLLKCTSEYPATLEQANLLTIPDMIKEFGVKVGVSDHTMDSIVPMSAVVLGARIIEKHFILDRSLGGADSAFSMEPAEFKEMVENVRNVEKTLGQVYYNGSPEQKKRRRGLYACLDIKCGEPFTSNNVRSYRPAAGLEPVYYDELLTKISKRNIKKGYPILPIDLV